ncbi:MAG: cupin domain-containing protein [Calditrichaeota bacterium]|nr:cupin domain-containing protein [Calditrichota bacterium]
MKGHIGCVLDGELEINFSGELITFKAGDGVFIPAGEEGKHMARALTDTATLLLIEDI